MNRRLLASKRNRKLLAWAALLAFSAAAARTAKALGRERSPDHMGRVPHMLKRPHDAADCPLNWDFAKAPSELAFIVASERRVIPICFTQRDENGLPSGYRIYSETHGIPEKKRLGCTISYITNLRGYGTLDGVIYIGKLYHSQPIPDRLAGAFCEECAKLITHMSQPYDIFLFHTVTGVIYDLCGGNYKFSLGRYDIATHVNWDRTTSISIVDRWLRAIERNTRRDWRKAGFVKHKNIFPKENF